jgi:hypothetical protein
MYTPVVPNMTNASPLNQGYVLPENRVPVSDGAATLRYATIASSPMSFDLPAQPRRVVDQGQEVPCCVSCALSAAVEVLYPNWPALAPIFHYYVTRYQNAGADSSGSLHLDSGLLTLQENGICRIEDHDRPYTNAGASAVPSALAYADALTRRMGKLQHKSRWQSLGGMSLALEIRDQLRLGRPVVLGFQLPQGYPAKFLNANFEWLDPNELPRSSSGHCALVVGFNDARQAFRIHDSHGAGSFENGRWWMGYRIADSSIIADAFSLV